MMGTEILKKVVSIQSDKELAQEFRDFFIGGLMSEPPPCFSCEDKKVARCTLTEFQCMRYKVFVQTGRLT